MFNFVKTRKVSVCIAAAVVDSNLSQEMESKLKKHSSFFIKTDDRRDCTEL